MTSHPKNSRSRRNYLASAMACSALICLPTNAQAQSVPVPTPDTLVSVCSGVSLPPSVVTGILDPVLTGIYGPIENRVNGLLTILDPLVLPLLRTTRQPFEAVERQADRCDPADPVNGEDLVELARGGLDAGEELACGLVGAEIIASALRATGSSADEPREAARRRSSSLRRTRGTL